eukprot:14047254-Alexandrium_andersonii.AAC.1
MWPRTCNRGEVGWPSWATTGRGSDERLLALRDSLPRWVIERVECVRVLIRTSSKPDVLGFPRCAPL